MNPTPKRLHKTCASEHRALTDTSEVFDLHTACRLSIGEFGSDTHIYTHARTGFNVEPLDSAIPYIPRSPRIQNKARDREPHPTLCLQVPQLLAFEGGLKGKG